jgi:hypothetical protein
MIVTGQGLTVGALRRLHEGHQGIRNAAGEPITSRVWDLTTAILLEVLADRGAPPTSLAELLDALKSLRAAIVQANANSPTDTRR